MAHSGCSRRQPVCWTANWRRRQSGIAANQVLPDACIKPATRRKSVRLLETFCADYEDRRDGEDGGCIRAGRLLLVSPFTEKARRVTAELAVERNRFVAA